MFYAKYADAVQVARQWVEEMEEYEHDMDDMPLTPIPREEGGMPIFKIRFMEVPGFYDYHEVDDRFIYFVTAYEGQREAEVVQCTTSGEKPIGLIGRYGRSEQFHKLAR